MLMASAAGLTLVPVVEVRVRAVTLGDLTRNATDEQAGRVVLRLRAGQRHVTLPAPAVAAMIRRATGLRVAGADRVAITLAPPPPPIRHDRPPAALLPKGTALTLRSVVGPVAIERAVTTLQPGRPGRPVFVRDAGGQVFAAPLVTEAGA